ncbi:protein GAMETE EXPRESSED 2 isoform X4 [Juglans microcarpa x Juglans regia]|uniref:protein GAMETE EXPRESSED 2 isoform X4 n=1 Tax=Juglans microcarpa x Juglans regia TaxID=2249226 RepID=UPI001B7F52BA|nr:protein GAMETE EXPRESSED 2 isoform X4 [Juglans microcarpa x Juglans regia]
MAVLMHLHVVIFLALAFSSFTATGSDPASSEEESLPKFAFSWLDDKDTFRAGDIANIKIKVLEHADRLDRNAFKPILTVNGKMGNSSYVSGVLLDFAGNPSDWRISFTVITVGLFNVFIEENNFHVFDSSMHFQVEPGQMYPSACVASWMNLMNEFEAGMKATILILLKDAFGNNISSTGEDPSLYNFTVSSLYVNGSVASVPNISFMGSNELGYVIIEFIVVQAGDLLLRVEGDNETLRGSPLPFKVNPGPLEVSNCMATWNFEPNGWQLFSKMEIFIYQKDQYGNLVPGLYEFDAEVVEKETNLSIPVADLHFEEVMAGIQLFSFSNLEPGNFLLTIYDIMHNKCISNMPYAYTVFVGYCDGLKSVVNGSGLNNSIAGEVAEFTVYLKDLYQYPSAVEVERLQVQIVRESDSYYVSPTISPLRVINGSEPTRRLRYGATSQIEIAPSPSFELSNSSAGSTKVQASSFNVVYSPDKSGIYEIHVFCGNVLLNGGHSFTKEVIAGEVNTSLSGVLRFSPKVPRLIKNEIIVQLLDSFQNPVFSQQSRLKLEIVSRNNSEFSSWMFVDNNDGSYTVHYMAKDVGTYEMCASFNGISFSPCPFGVNVYSSEYFPSAYSDTISIWEDESIAFDALANDYFAGDNASIAEYTKPDHGSLVQYGRHLRYTPYKDYYGNDSFSYTMSDINGNLASASVNISVLSIPPQFVSSPSLLQVTEDVLSPRFGNFLSLCRGFFGFEIRYSDQMENISIILTAQAGTVFLSPMLMQFWEPMWSGLSVNRGGEEAKDLILEGRVEVINFALQSIQYLGERDEFEFCIGDPDLPTFPGGDINFLVTFSVEVNDGFLVASLPADLIDTTELKLKHNYMWQPLQTYVAISKHFAVKASGIRFRGSVNNCNSIMQHLFYHGGEHGAVLTITLNDMGNHGCYPDCAERVSLPLYTTAAVNLIRKRPMSSFVAHALGSAIVIEFLVVFSFGVLLLFFICKCAILLANERRKRHAKTSEPSIVQSSYDRTPSRNLSQDATHFTGCFSSSFLPGSQLSNFRKRSRRRLSGKGESSRQAFRSCDQSQRTSLPSFKPLAVEKKHGETA